jgi:hypothetical protein
VTDDHPARHTAKPVEGMAVPGSAEGHDEEPGLVVNPEGQRSLGLLGPRFFLLSTAKRPNFITDSAH